MVISNFREWYARLQRDAKRSSQALDTLMEIDKRIVLMGMPEEQAIEIIYQEDIEWKK